MKLVRLQKFLANCGIGSRRKCEQFISEGRIIVDWQVVKEQGLKIDPIKNIVTFDGRKLEPEKKLWIMLNKPPKYICSNQDPSGKPSFLELLPNNLGRMYAVGRLDYMSEGLLLMTNDGDVVYRLTHPKYEIQKVYDVKTVEKLKQNQINQILKGIKSENEILRIIKINVKENSCLITLAEGKNRHIRRIMSELGIHILKLKRVAIGPLEIGTLEKGKWRFLTDEEIYLLKKEVGI
jgi:23S rRNA pseudouridine2605 synthase